MSISQDDHQKKESPLNTDDEYVKAEGEPLIIANEFAYVSVRKVNTRNGMRLEVNSPRLGFKIYLDPLELESLTWQTKETFSKLLEKPFGR